MSNNYTPVNREELEKKFSQPSKKNSSIDTILLLIGTLTAIVLAFLLFVLIQKKMQATQASPLPTVVVTSPTVTSTEAPPPEVMVTTTVTPPATPSATLTPATQSATLTPSPTTVATPSATQTP